jgi:hypothetical protein
MNTENVPVELDIPIEHLPHLASLMAQSHADSAQSMVEDALTLLLLASNEVKEGNTIASLDESAMTYKGLVIPALNFRPNVNGGHLSDGKLPASAPAFS